MSELRSRYRESAAFCSSSTTTSSRAFGNRDHTTVMSAVRKVENLRTTDPEVRAHLEALERKLGTND